MLSGGLILEKQWMLNQVVWGLQWGGCLILWKELKLTLVEVIRTSKQCVMPKCVQRMGFPTVHLNCALYCAGCHHFAWGGLGRE